MIQAHLERAQQLVTLQRYKDAETELRSVLSSQPDNTEALALISICFSQQGKPDEATRAIQNAIGKEPDNDYLLYLQALFYFNDDKLKEAEKFIRNAISYDPHNADYFGLLSAINLKQKEWKQALENANRGLEADPDNLQSLNSRSSALYKLDKKDDAYATIQEALNQDPENAHTHTNLGWSLLEMGQHKKSLEHFREALKINPGYEFAKAGMVEALKARYLFYRIFLKYAFWINNFKGKAQWAIILGLYFGFKFLNNLSENNEELAVFLNPVIYLYFAFAISTWIITPLSNLLLRLNVYGRYALTEHEIKASSLVGIALLIGVGGFCSYLFNDNFFYLIIGVFGIGMMIPLGSMLTPDKQKQKNILIGYTVFLALAGLATIFMHASTGEVPIFFPIFTFGVVIYQWVANWLLIKM
jgi:tetratricopeptide (TPR) repeat protein